MPELPRRQLRRLPAVVIWASILAASTTGPVAGQSALLEGYRLVDTWTSRSPGGSVPTFKRPTGVDVAPDGDVYVADQDANRVVRLSAQGDVARSPHGGQAVRPRQQPHRRAHARRCGGRSAGGPRGERRRRRARRPALRSPAHECRRERQDGHRHL